MAPTAGSAWLVTTMSAVPARPWPVAGETVGAERAAGHADALPRADDTLDLAQNRSGTSGTTSSSGLCVPTTTSGSAAARPAQCCRGNCVEQLLRWPVVGWVELLL